MTINILPEFIEDLKSLDNIKTLGRVLDKLFDDKFEFKRDKDDHRYNGVQDAWIRDISKGSTAYRSIYIRKGESVYLYRTGTKKIEENLVQPNLDGTIFGLQDFKVEVTSYINQSFESGKLLRSPEPQELSKEIFKFIHIPLREMWIVSPVISREMFDNTNIFGKFINKVLENNAIVTVVTRPPSHEDIKFFDKLEEEKEIIVLYNKTLHAKLWYFSIDTNVIIPSNIESGYTNTAILGSADLTMNGLGLNNSNPENNNIELCYRLPYEKNDEFYKYCDYLFDQSIEHSKYKRDIKWQ